MGSIYYNPNITLAEKKSFRHGIFQVPDILRRRNSLWTRSNIPYGVRSPRYLLRISMPLPLSAVTGPPHLPPPSSGVPVEPSLHPFIVQLPMTLYIAFYDRVTPYLESAHVPSTRKVTENFIRRSTSSTISSATVLLQLLWGGKYVRL